MSKNETIVDRVVQRLKTQPLGDLITEEDLHDVVKSAIPKTFFEERRIPTGSYGRDEVKPPLIVETMKELLSAEAKRACEQWLQDNAEMVAAQWRAVFDKSLSEYVAKYHSDMVAAHVFQQLQVSFARVNEERRNQGLPPII